MKTGVSTGFYPRQSFAGLWYSERKSCLITLKHSSAAKDHLPKSWCKLPRSSRRGKFSFFVSLLSIYNCLRQSGPDNPLHGNRGPKPQGAVEQAGSHRRPQVEFLPSSIILSCSSPVFNVLCVLRTMLSISPPKKRCFEIANIEVS